MKGKFCGDTTPVLLQLHWLPVLLRMNFKIQLFSFKAIYGLALSYTADLVSVKPLTRYGNQFDNGIMLSYPNLKELNNLG